MSLNENTSINGTHPVMPPALCFNPVTRKIGETIAYCLLFVVSLVGNSFIVIIVPKTKTVRKATNILIVNMAASDLLYPVFLFPKNLTEVYLHSGLVSGDVGETLCKLVPFIADVSTSVSIQSLVLIAVDRFGTVVFPLRTPFIGSKLCRFLLLATWIISLAFHLPYLFAFSLVEYTEGTKCALQWSEALGDTLSLKNYILGACISLAYIPLFLIFLLYLIIILKLKSQTTLGEQSANAVKRRVKRELKVLKMSIAIVLGFTICRIPLTIRLLFLFFPPNISMIESCGFKYFAYVAHFLNHSYCAVNPCIYFIFSGNYREGLKYLFGLRNSSSK